MKLSVLMPVFNEKGTLDDILDRIVAAPLPGDMTMEIVCVDDCSTDGSWDILQARAAKDPRIRPFKQAKNQGKGAAIRAAVQHADGDIALIQDADLEYNPADYKRMLIPFLEHGADVVYGSRFTPTEYRRILFFWHGVVNKALTTFSNMLTDMNLTDMETGYKAFRMSVLKTIPIRSDRFGIEPELTAKVAKRRLRVFEVPIQYEGRTYAEGKKIGAKDAFEAFWVILKYHYIDDLYIGKFGETTLRSMELATRFTVWLMEKIDPYLGPAVLEVGSGIGNNLRAMTGHDLLVATETDLEYLAILRNTFAGRRRIVVEQWDISKKAPATIPAVDSILCSNVLEHVEDDNAALSNMSSVLKPGGRLVLIVPAGAKRYGSIDKALDHYRRYGRKALENQLRTAGWEVEKSFSMNKPGVLGWILNGQVLHRKALPRFQLKLFNALVPLFRVIDPLFPWTGLSLVVVAKKPVGR